MKAFAATLFGPEDLRVVDTELGPLAPGMVRIRFGAGGIFSTDEAFQGGNQEFLGSWNDGLAYYTSVKFTANDELTFLWDFHDTRAARKGDRIQLTMTDAEGVTVLSASATVTSASEDSETCGTTCTSAYVTLREDE